MNVTPMTRQKAQSVNRILGLAVVMFSLTLGACKGGSSPTEPVRGPGLASLQRQLTLVSGDGQRGPAGEALAQPLVVRVTDGSGQPLAGASVWWTPVEGDGQIPGPRVTQDGQPGEATALATDAEGLARANLILGSRLGLYTVEAITPFSNDRIMFVATAE